jgi:hypothetical protein
VLQWHSPCSQIIFRYRAAVEACAYERTVTVTGDSAALSEFQCSATEMSGAAVWQATRESAFDRSNAALDHNGTASHRDPYRNTSGRAAGFLHCQPSLNAQTRLFLSSACSTSSFQVVPEKPRCNAVLRRFCPPRPVRFHSSSSRPLPRHHTRTASTTICRPNRPASRSICTACLHAERDLHPEKTTFADSDLHLPTPAPCSDQPAGLLAK